MNNTATINNTESVLRFAAEPSAFKKADPKSPWPQPVSQLALVQNDVARIRERTPDGSSRSVLSVERKTRAGEWLEVGRYEIDAEGREWAWSAYEALTARYAPGHAVALSA